ncbi:CapA family protein [Solwaraspora sp. WMMD1047]|uniref:CapA family protein n=1 Tax=Solwaraspora sp. WMMD1047 TaxID=3016102 RepID=UPI0024169F02|nr:CapA family protein [Solwaraspora sp. WMMD1047]MDG4831290.1 CapA family protein [Solwaraspora sp. WMMD1047]
MRRLLGSLLVVGALATASCARPAADDPASGVPTGAPEPVAAPAATAPPDRITIVAAGDLLVHPPLTDQAAADARAAGVPGHDFTRVLAAVRPVASRADLAICHLETPLAEPTGPFTGFPLFSVPHQLADAAAWAGFDTCSTASNHSLDTGLAGVTRTLDNLDRVGLRHAGTARTPAEAARPTIIDVSGVPVAHLSYTFSLNGIPRPPGRPWVANLIDRDAILDEARRARKLGAQIVVLSVQWGTEYQNAPDDGQLALARELLAAPDLDLIVGHHVHVVQPFEKIGQKWVAYGIGNLITRFPDGSPENTQDAVVPEFTFVRTSPTRWRVAQVEVTPTWMEYYPAARLVDLTSALADRRVSGARRADYTRIRHRIIGYLDLLGALDQGLRIVRPGAGSPAIEPV